MLFKTALFTHFLNEFSEEEKKKIKIQSKTEFGTNTIGVYNFTQEGGLVISGGDEFFVCVSLNGDCEKPLFGITWDVLESLFSKEERLNDDFFPVETEKANALFDAFEAFFLNQISIAS